MILLKKITLNNFLSHKDTTVNFDSNEKILLDGQSGAGKSSIFDAIIFALYGKGRVDNRSLVRKGTQKGIVTLELTRNDQQDTVIITRTITKAGKHILEITLQSPDGSKKAYPLSGVRELQNFIDKELIGASYLLFINSVAYVQGNTESFVAQTAPKRKELLLEIVKADDYTKYHENAKKTLSELENEQSSINGRILELEAHFAQIKSKIGTPQAHIQAIEENTKALNAVIPQIEVLEEEKAKFISLEQTIGTLTMAFNKAMADRDSSEKTLASKKKKIEDKSKLLKILEAVPEKEKEIKASQELLSALRVQLSSISEQEKTRNEYLAKKPNVVDRSIEINHHQNQMNLFQKAPPCPSGGDCPYYSQDIIAATQHQEIIAELTLKTNNEIEALAKWSIGLKNLPAATDIHSLLKIIEQTESTIKNLELDFMNFESVKKDLSIISEIESEIPTFEKDFETKKAYAEHSLLELKKAESLIDNNEMNRIANELISKRQDKDIFNANIIKATAALENIERDEQEMNSLTSQIATLNDVTLVDINGKIKKVEMVKQAFSSKGIETLVVDYLLTLLEDKINIILSYLSDFKIYLDTQRKNVNTEGIVEGLWITVENECGEKLPYESYSGGEKVRIIFAISEAFASFVKNKVGFRLIDEAVLALDENSLESFLKTVRILLADFNQIFFISHIQEVKDLFEKQIKIKKNNGISKI